jgi:hypothetical protein
VYKVFKNLDYCLFLKKMTLFSQDRNRRLWESFPKTSKTDNFNTFSIYCVPLGADREALGARSVTLGACSVAFLPIASRMELIA